jgi:cGMP-dependent protein kinase
MRVQENLRRRHLADRIRRRQQRDQRGQILRAGDNDDDGTRSRMAGSPRKEYVKEEHFVEKPESVQFLIKHSLQDHFLFQNLSQDVIQDAVNVMTRVDVRAGDMVIVQGDEKGDKFYVIGDGKFDILVNDICVVTYRRGQNFGELALMYDAPRAASIRASTDGVLWALDRVPFRLFVASAAQLRASTVENFLLEVPLFQPPHTDDEELHRLAQAMSRQHYRQGKVIINQGDVGEVFYLIEEGSVSCRKDGKHVLSLGKGDFFGERALITQNRRAMTIVAQTECDVLTMHKDQFEFMTANPRVAAHMDETHQERARLEQEALTHGRRVLPPLALADLEIVRVVGKGAYGMVKLARRRSTNEPLALKVMQKSRVVMTKQAHNVITEKNLMHDLNHPFVVRLIATMTCPDCLYIATEYLGGGDLFGKLCDFDGCLDPEAACYFSACVVSAFGHIHGKRIVYRDLKPENLVLDAAGRIKLVDFGMAKVVEVRTFTVCGTPEYMAPEIIHGTGHGRAADYWALGVLVYEMLCGITPFADETSSSHLKIYKRVDRHCTLFEKRAEDSRKTLIEWPNWVRSRAVRDLVLGLLTPRVSHRLGLQRDAADVKAHAWYGPGEMAVDWSKLDSGDVEPPLQPAMDSPFDTQNFDDWGDDASITVPYEDTGAAYETLWVTHFGPVQPSPSAGAAAGTGGA